jgi:hypothetical protein
MNSPNYKENPRPISASDEIDSSKDVQPDELEDLLDAQTQDGILFQHISNVQVGGSRTPLSNESCGPVSSIL